MNTTPNAEFAIRCEALTRDYGEVKALDSLNLSVPKGSIFGFLGRNGAGKTTTMRLLTGLAHPTSGSAWIAGVETTNGDSAAASKFGYLPQQPVFYGWMRAWEYLDYVARLHKIPAAQRKIRIDQVLEMVGLKDAKKRKVAGFSGGMKQRLGIAQAVIHQPEVLLLDEPSRGVDVGARYEIYKIIREMAARGVAILLVSSDLTEILGLSDRVLVMREGKMVKELPAKGLTQETILRYCYGEEK